jgi:hypothetical protein
VVVVEATKKLAQDLTHDEGSGGVFVPKIIWLNGTGYLTPVGVEAVLDILHDLKTPSRFGCHELWVQVKEIDVDVGCLTNDCCHLANGIGGCHCLVDPSGDVRSPVVRWVVTVEFGYLSVDFGKQTL